MKNSRNGMLCLSFGLRLNTSSGTPKCSWKISLLFGLHRGQLKGVGTRVWGLGDTPNPTPPFDESPAFGESLVARTHSSLTWTPAIANDRPSPRED